MSSLDDAQFANSIGSFYQQIGQQMGNYLQSNIGTLSKTPGQLTIFCDDQSRIISYANTFYSLSDQIAFDNSDVYFAAVTAATAGMNANIKTIDKIDKWINFSAAIITLATAIVSKNGSNILSSIETIKGTFS